MPIAARATLVAAWLITGCACAGAPPQPAPSGAPPGASRGNPADTALLDRITTLETLFPEAADRDLYETHPVAEGVQRSYTFALKSQPGFDPARHFQLVTVSWTPLDNAKPRGSGATTGTGGPDGSFVEQTAQTSDKKYDVRVTLGELLPANAKSATVDVAEIANRLVERYAQQTKP
jgi:hypothetical protein